MDFPTYLPINEAFSVSVYAFGVVNKQLSLWRKHSANANSTDVFGAFTGLLDKCHSRVPPLKEVLVLRTN